MPLRSNPLFNPEPQPQAVTPERRLLVAILDDVRSCLAYKGTASGSGLQSVEAITVHQRRLHDEAERWVTSNDRVESFSFVNCCDWLGLDIEAMRMGLLGRKRNG